MTVEHIGDGNPDGSNFIQSGEKGAVYGATPVIQPVAINQAAITDSSGGTVGTTLASTLGRVLLTIPIADMVKIADVDLLTDFVPKFAGKILALDWWQEDPVTTGSKASTISMDIETTAVTGGVLSLTSAACTPLGKIINGTAITAANTFTAAQKITIKGASTTAFGEGSGAFIITLQNDDMVNAIASMAALQDEMRTAMVNFGSMKGAA